MTQVRRLITPDPECRAYFSRTELTQTICVQERSLPVIDTNGTPADCSVAEEVITIPGVCLVQVRPYVLTVVKAPTYEWDEIEPALLRFLTSFNLGEGKLEAEP